MRTATAAVLYQTVYEEGRRFISAGGDAMLLRRQLESGMKAMLAAMQEQVQLVSETEEIERLALSIGGQRNIAAALADIFEVLSPYASIELRDGARELQHEFFLGFVLGGQSSLEHRIRGSRR